VEQPGTYYGQCSELCGVNHGFMPITVQAMSKPEFDAWVAEAQTKFARADQDDLQVARATAPAKPAN
jgi:cytochrome c oxidase subunit II